MKNIINKKDSTWVKKVKILFYLLFSIFCYIIINYYIYKDNICNTNLCDKSIDYILSISFGCIIFMPVFFIRNILLWKKYLYISIIVGILILIFNRSDYGNYFWPSRDTMSMSWSIISLLYSLFYIYKERIQNKIKK